MHRKVWVSVAASWPLGVVIAGLWLMALTAAALVPVAVPRDALAKCQPSTHHAYRINDSNHYFSGMEWYQGPSTTVGGVFAEISNVSPWVEPALRSDGTQAVSTAWVMLTHEGQYLWAQAGWVEFPGGQRFTVSQTRNSAVGNPITYLTSSRPSPGYTYYTVQWDNPSGKFSYWYRDSSQGSPTKFHEDDWGFFPNEAQIEGEITTYSSQMPGVANDTEGFYDAQRYIAPSWVAFAATHAVPTSAEFPLDGPYAGGSQLYIWDGACASAN